MSREIRCPMNGTIPSRFALMITNPKKTDASAKNIMMTVSRVLTHSSLVTALVSTTGSQCPLWIESRHQRVSTKTCPTSGPLVHNRNDDPDPAFASFMLAFPFPGPTFRRTRKVAAFARFAAALLFVNTRRHCEDWGRFAVKPVDKSALIPTFLVKSWVRLTFSLGLRLGMIQRFSPWAQRVAAWGRISR